MKRFRKKMFHSIMAGVYIALGGMTYLIIPDKTIAAMFFAMGIFLVINFSNMLFTRVVPLSDATGEYKAYDCLVSWFGNGIGAFTVATLAHFTRYEAKVLERLEPLCLEKLNDTPLSLFIMGIFCSIYVSYAVFSTKKTNNGSLLQIFLVWILITAFVFGGYDHIVANFFYLTLYSWSFGLPAFASLAKVVGFVTLGNIAGSLIASAIEKNFIVNND